LTSHQYVLSIKTKILIIRFSSIGDIVLTTPVIRCLKEQIDGECEIHYLVKQQFSTILKGNPYIDVIHEFGNSLKKVTEGLEKEGFHYIIDLHKNVRSSYVKKRLPGLSFAFDKLNVKKWILVNFKIDLLPDLHIVDRYFDATKALGIENDGKGIDYFIPEEDKISTSEMFGADPGSYVVFSIGAAHEGKKLPLYKMIELCSIIDRKIILLGGDEDIDNASAIAAANSNVINVCGKLRLNQSASAIEQATLVISHDSGLMHIASAFNKKIISIWGATVPKFGMYPYNAHPDSIMIQADHLKFRPTSKLGNKNTRKERRTTEEIDLTRILEAVDKLWIGG